MPGRRLLSDEEVIAESNGHFADAASYRRRAVLRETIGAWEGQDPPDRYHRLAAANLERWRRSRAARKTAQRVEVEVHAGDWGEVTALLTRRHGIAFAVLNMANAHVPGGAYVEGAIAQEENMFRRTDCHFSIDADTLDAETDCYHRPMTHLLQARGGAVYLDTGRPRVCLRGPEDRARADLGYRWLADDEVFPFYELRAAAQDLRGGAAFDPAEARHRIAAQLDTLRTHGLRHAVLSAFGCGAFRNPVEAVAQIYRDEIAARAADFDLLAFAIFAPGYGPDNYTPFARTLASGV